VSSAVLLAQHLEASNLQDFWAATNSCKDTLKHGETMQQYSTQPIRLDVPRHAVMSHHIFLPFLHTCCSASSALSSLLPPMAPT